jgi:hypothetical protein
MNAALDTSSRQTITARLNTDGITVTRITANHSTGAVDVTTVTTGSVTPTNFAGTDENGRTTLFAVSENDPTQLVALQCDSTGALLIKMI